MVVHNFIVNTTLGPFYELSPYMLFPESSLKETEIYEFCGLEKGLFLPWFMTTGGHEN